MNKNMTSKKNQVINHAHLEDYQAILDDPKRLQIEVILSDAKREVKEILLASKDKPIDFLWLEKISLAVEKVSHAWGILNHLHAAVSLPAVRKLYLSLLPKVTQFMLWLKQNEKIYSLYMQVKEDLIYFNSLNKIEQKIVNDSIRDFKLEGVNLKPSLKRKYKRWNKKIGLYSARFSNNLLDEINEYQLWIVDRQDVKDLPVSALQQARMQADRAIKNKNFKSDKASGLSHMQKEKQKDAWLFTLQAPSYLSFMKYASNEKLREKLYRAYVSKASTGKRDNGILIEKILTLRGKMANLLDFENYANLSLATKMATSVEEVERFLWDLHARSKKMAQLEIQELLRCKCRRTDKSIKTETLNAWDILYYSEKLREEKFKYSEEELKKYFPIDKALVGIFSVIEKLFGYTFKDLGRERNAKQMRKKFWHQDVELYALLDKKNQLRGYLYFDLYARENKRSGAWMDECRCRYAPWRNQEQNGNKALKEIYLPIAYVVANFTPPTSDGNSDQQKTKSISKVLLSHEDVLTLFHEMGHAIHHLFTKMEHLDVSGIRGVPWDGVELPSQFLEHWAWHQQGLQLASDHVENRKPITPSLIKKLLATKNFQSGLAMLRQIELALIDMALHAKYLDGNWKSVNDFVVTLRNQVSVLETPAYNRFQNSFLHIFAGGYAAGYYSYKWAERLSSDAFSLFEEKGIFNAEAGERFLEHILEMGGGYHFMEMYERFRGRKPNSEALLRHAGIADTNIQKKQARPKAS